MGQRWILDVLRDIRAFAAQNDLPALVNQMDEALAVAAAEISSQPPKRNSQSTGEKV